MKSKKIIATLMALSIIGSSSVVLGGNVKAASVKSNQPVQRSIDVKENLKSQVNVNSIIPINQKFSVYYEFPGGVIHEVEEYIRDCARKNVSPNSDGIRSVLIENGVSKNVANNISYSLLSLASKAIPKSTDRAYLESWFVDVFADNISGSSKYVMLTNGDGEFCLAHINAPNKNYSIYGILTIKDIENVLETIKKNPHDKNGSEAYIQNYLQEIVLKSNLVQDKDMARKIGNNLYNLIEYRDYVMNDLKTANENLLVLISDDNQRVTITRQSR
ncbi:hypothetical protein [Clostridium drakei]|uniref:Uncharacterized protein n=1 Tax=Clostridium drakei TaxID=332101 RepID=A0A2U8DXK4_9CLOT|nr:hypothetical protein [Clostridium drakei]AWI06782.1 hypothetical protein B9W14_20540 [Clostridium drakei]